MGGNVFKGSIPTKPIKREDIKPTLREFFREFEKACPGAVLHFKGVFPLGSTGKKDISGDIDLGIDEKSFTNIEDWNIEKSRVQEIFLAVKKRARTASDKQLMKRAIIQAIAEKVQESDTDINVDSKGAVNGTLFCEFPQYSSEGTKTGDWVQIDINIGNPDWLNFAYHSETYQGNVKGLHRTQLMLTLFAHKGLTFSHNYGVKDKESGKILASTSDKAVELLNNLYGFNDRMTKEILSDYYKLQDFLKKNLSKQELNQIYDRFLKILDSTRCDIPNDLENYWLDNQERLGLTGKFLPPSSKLYAFRDI